MRDAYLLVAALTALVGIGCGEDAHETDGGPRDAGDAPTDAGPPVPGTDAGPPGADAGPGVDAGPGPTCTPSPGGASVEGRCDQLSLALLDDGAGNVEARLTGRLTPDGLTEGDCAHVDEVEVLEGSVSIGTIAGAGAFEVSDQWALLAEGPSFPMLNAECDSDEGRFEGLGLIVRGRVDGGAFEARCAAADSGGHWPPRLVTTCHENLDTPPGRANGAVDVFMGNTSLSIYAAFPHGPGGALTSVDATVHVIPQLDPFGGQPPVEPFDITVDPHVGEGSTPLLGTHSAVNLFAAPDPLGETLCPAGSDDPFGPLPPVMLLQMTGTSERGAFSTEAYMDLCTRPTPAP